MLETSAVVGNMSGLFVAAFLSHFLGFTGPFGFIGALSIILTLFLNKLVDFVKVTDDIEQKQLLGPDQPSIDNK
jgi:predicted MFS family arabinose efflux permease